MREFSERLKQLPEPDETSAAAAAARQARLTKPPGSLGRLEALTIWLAAWQGRDPPALGRVAALVFAGNHGVTARGVSAYPAAVTAQMVANFEAGGAAINQLCRTAAADLAVVPLDLDRPTEDFCAGPAMSEADCLDALNRGMGAVGPGLDLVAIGEMGIGNTTSAAAICAALYGGGAGLWTGPGTGLDAGGVAHKAAVIDLALRHHRQALHDPLEILRRLGGREIAAMAGAIVA
ncbi:MAG: nicotinate-nucleotide--dimethylbenzimidazole phosphoribosyltransferase, partial [Alphaproteobacteria bacterium]